MSDKDGKYLPWMEGLPTRPDVDALFVAFPPTNLLPGVKISDEAFRAVVGKCEGVRFRTVYTAWIRRLKADYNVLMKREKELGFFVPTPAEVMASTYPTVRHTGRCYAKQIRDLSIIKPAEGTETITRDHHGQLLGALKRETKKARMNILPPTESKPQPQISPPKKKAGN